MALALLASCSGGAEDCPAMAAGDERDACYLVQVSAHAERGEGAQAIDDVRAIESPLMRSAAIQSLATSEGSGVDSSSIEVLCEELPSPNAAQCLKRWTRPHLWPQTGGAQPR
ncbi:MAG TPA: hypothetical protein QGF58_28965 [Myxococcota bacterium]|nr:hypothetical protein [Myxococcota bacterium]